MSSEARAERWSKEAYQALAVAFSELSRAHMDTEKKQAVVACMAAQGQNFTWEGIR